MEELTREKVIETLVLLDLNFVKQKAKKNSQIEEIDEFLTSIFKYGTTGYYNIDSKELEQIYFEETQTKIKIVN